MKARFIILLAINIALVVGVLLFTQSWMARNSKTQTDANANMPPPPEMVEVLTATEALVPGTLLKPNHVEWTPWPKNNLSDAFISKTKDTEEAKVSEAEASIVGGVVRFNLSKGQPLVAGLIVKPGERGFLAAILEPDKRAMAISVTASSSGAGLILPGDRVDVLLTQTIEIKTEEEDLKRKASEILISDVRLLALDQKITSDPAAPEVGRTATLEVTPRDAQLLALAEEMGKLSLVLRSIQTTENDHHGRMATWDFNASMALGSETSKVSVPAVIRGGTTNKN
ncbi:Flp pilus assembly protein CpaB [Iodidimonas sp. SYSU 1G8]|uniref:Flp pilus assembly protein CpaB n=1 Tax=Iodidimonas sp. SYSU 1G8 TaxID=3133967 RepID=UPI0031FE974A